MKFTDIYFNKEHSFSLGKTADGITYISIPVSNHRVDYEEYYKIDNDLIENYPDNIKELIYIANCCRRREQDSNLLDKPGSDRGVPVWPA